VEPAAPATPSLPSAFGIAPHPIPPVPATAATVSVADISMLTAGMRFKNARHPIPDAEPAVQPPPHRSNTRQNPPLAARRVARAQKRVPPHLSKMVFSDGSAMDNTGGSSPGTYGTHQCVRFAALHRQIQLRFPRPAKYPSHLRLIPWPSITFPRIASDGLPASTTPRHSMAGALVEFPLK